MSKAAVCLITLFCAVSLTDGIGDNKNVPTEKNIPKAIADKFEKRVGNQKFSDWKVRKVSNDWQSNHFLLHSPEKIYQNL